MNPNELGRSVQGGNGETKWEQRKRKDKQAMGLYRGRFEAERIRERRELQQQIGDWL